MVVGCVKISRLGQAVHGIAQTDPPLCTINLITQLYTMEEISYILQHAKGIANGIYEISTG